jgi:hypothetical protein
LICRALFILDQIVYHLHRRKIHGDYEDLSIPVQTSNWQKDWPSLLLAAAPAPDVLMFSGVFPWMSVASLDSVMCFFPAKWKMEWMILAQVKSK